MSTTTANLGLFKYDTSTDSQTAFSINTALNNNWDILDTAIATSSGVSTTVNGTTWYRIWNDGWKEQGGLVSLAEAEVNWEQPTLTSNGSAGGNTVAAYQTGGIHSSAVGAYGAFDNNSSTCARFAYNGYKLVLYTPYEIKVSAVNFNCNMNGSNEYPSNWSIQGSKDGTNWTNLVTGGNQGLTPSIVIPEANRAFYQYHALHITTGGGAQNTSIVQLNYTATYLSQVAKVVTFPVAFSNTNYSHCLSFEGGNDGGAYVDTKSITGMSLHNTAATQASWTACGY